MKAVIYRQYGPPEVLKVEEVSKPAPKADELLIKVHAVSINGTDRERLRGKPLYARSGLLKPRNRTPCSDIAGRVESAGKHNSETSPGDEVFGELPGYHGGLAEYVCTHGRTLAPKPPGLTFEAAAVIPQAGTIALRGIVEKGRAKPGQRVLINGAGGSVGSFALQLAKLQGAEVTGVDHTEKLDFMRSLGADHVLDYTKEDYTRVGKQYDLILDVFAHRSAFSYQRALSTEGTFFYVGGSISLIFQILLIGPWIRRATGKELRLLAVPQNRSDLIAITEFCETGKVTPVIDKRVPMNEVQEAFRYVAEGEAKGKVVIPLVQEN